MGEKTRYIILGALAAVLTAALVIVAIVNLAPGDDGEDQADRSPAPTWEPGPTPTPEPAPSPTPGASIMTPPPRTYSVTATATAGGTIYPCGVILVDDGETLTLVIEADEGYEIESATFNGRDVRILDEHSFSYEIQYIKDDHELYVVFREAEIPEPSPTPTPEPTPEATPIPTRPPSSNTDIN